MMVYLCTKNRKICAVISEVRHQGLIMATLAGRLIFFGKKRPIGVLTDGLIFILSERLIDESTK